jgi:hypothetical protein
MTRSGFGQSKPVDEKKEESGPRRPTFTKQVRKEQESPSDGGFLTRSNMVAKKPLEEKKDAPLGQSIIAPGTNGGAGLWRSTGGAGTKP